MKLSNVKAVITSATGRLTMWYMAIVMAISLIFSFSVYRASTRELDSGLRRQARIFQLMPRFRDQPPNLLPRTEEQLAAAKQRIELNLVFLNLAILALAGAASYWFAKHTLSPIEAALEAQSRFTADASHELRTPLTAMKTEIEVALRDPKLGHAEAKQLLNSNLEEIAKLEALSNGLLRLAQGNGQALALSPVLLSSVTAQAISRLENTAKQRQVTVTSTQVEVVAAKADSDSLQELIVILLDNAIKYSEPKSQVEIKTTVHGHLAELSVSDQGQGIKSSDLPHIFDRFYRADTSRSKEQISGYGLGLSIAQKIAEAHSSKITVHSTFGQGSTFTIKLPLAEPKTT